MANTCSCNDYSYATANTGLGTLTTANPNIDGTGTVVTILTAAPLGTRLVSLTIKSQTATTQGNINIFVRNGVTTALILQIPVPIAPVAPTTPVPADPLANWGTYVALDYLLGPGDRLIASTQNAGAFNVIAEGLDISYPVTTPAVCCNFKKTNPNTGVGVVSVANPNTDGTGTIVSIFTATASNRGTVLKSITITALQSTTPNLVSLFITSPNPLGFQIINEISIPASSYGPDMPPFQISLPLNFNIAAGYQIGASTRITQSLAIDIQGETWLYPNP